MYIFATVNSAVGASKNHLTLHNGTNGGLVLWVYRVEVVPHQTAAVVGLNATYYLQRITTAGSGGTAAVVRKLDTMAPNLPATITSINAPATAPTITANSELAGRQVSTEETLGQSSQPVFQADQHTPPIPLRKGQGLVVQQSSLAGAGAVSIFIYFRTSKR